MTDERPGAAVLAALALVLLAALPAGAQTLSGADLVKALRQGGYVIVMRHASSPPEPPPPAKADPANVRDERQLDAAGRTAARAMGRAFHRMRLPIGEVWSSPTYRALQTLRLANLHGVRSVPELGDAGHSMQAASGAQADWLKAKAAEAPRPRTDTVIVTHQPNMTAAFGAAADGLTDGEALVFHPDGQGGADLVARVPMQDWPALAQAR
jgi:phosphohistidine phosphatase SixA